MLFGRRILIAGLLGAAAGCRGRVPGRLTIAAAANLTRVFDQIGRGFEKRTGIRPVFSFGSTAQLARQIENSAPFDLFAAADAEHIDQLEAKGLLAAGSRAVYATGVLALWIPPESRRPVSRLSDLALPDVRVVAVAKPELAPYGKASVETLQHLGIWDVVKPKIVYAENISMAKQFGSSGNADAVFTAYSLVLNAGGKAIPVDEGLHQPIIQKLGIMARSREQEAARAFADFLITGDGRQILLNNGYR